MLQTTLWVMVKDGQIFLWEKKRGFAKWVLNWIWGKQEWCENIEECMIREAKEEIWIDILKQKKVWIMHFYFEKKPDWNMAVHIFKIDSWEWEIIETEEIKPFWFPLDEIPYDKMWEDDTHWLPRVLAWETDVEYNFYFDKDNWKIIKFEKLK